MNNSRRQSRNFASHKLQQERALLKAVIRENISDLRRGPFDARGQITEGKFGDFLKKFAEASKETIAKNLHLAPKIADLLQKASKGEPVEDIAKEILQDYFSKNAKKDEKSADAEDKKDETPTASDQKAQQPQQGQAQTTQQK